MTKEPEGVGDGDPVAPNKLAGLADDDDSGLDSEDTGAADAPGVPSSEQSADDQDDSATAHHLDERD